MKDSLIRAAGHAVVAIALAGAVPMVLRAQEPQKGGGGGGAAVIPAAPLKITPQTGPKVARPPLLAPGTPAPEITPIAFGSTDRKVRLSDYKGKVLVLDFWATWCGPCMRSMPHLQQVYSRIKDQDVKVLAVNVWDSKEKYDEWVPANREKYSFDFAFDPAGRDRTQPRMTDPYKVSGIPTTYVIGKDGKVVAAIVGYGGEKDKRLDEALVKAGLKL